MAEVLQQAVEETSRKALEDRNERAAHQPNIDLTEDKDEIERVLSGESDLAFTMSYEMLPDIKLTDLAALKLEREVADVADGGGRQGAWRAGGALRSATRWRRTGRPATATGSPSTSSAASTASSSRAARARTCSSWSAQAASFRASSRASKGAKAGEERVVNAKFPDEYPEKDAGRQGRRVRRQGEGGGQADPARAQRRVRQDAGRREPRQAARSWSRPRSPASTPSIARMKLKRQILDALDKAHDFAAARDAGRRRVRRHLEAGDAEPGAGRQDLRRRGQDRGGAARPSTARSPSGACASASSSARSATRASCR